MTDTKRMLLANKAWAQERKSVTPSYFTEMARGQQPDVLWIGCSDSRVPAEEITGASPGELFVHRNVANLVVNTDMNLLSVLQYAVESLKVPHIVVCGHSSCGGVAAAMTDQNLGFLNTWLRHIKDTWNKHRAEIDLHESAPEKVRRLVELNVLEQVQNLVKTSIVQAAWARGEGPTLHGWVYQVSEGLIEPLVEVKPGSAVDPIYRYDVG